jgi:L-fuculose-phosphate aldolase
MTSHEHNLRESLCRFVQRGCRQRLLRSNDGCFSVRMDQRSLLITPDRCDRERIEPRDLIRVDDEHCEWEMVPCREARIHQTIYRNHPNVNAVVFARPIHATAFSASETLFNSRMIPESYVVLREVKKVSIGEVEHMGGSAQYLSRSAPAVIVQNHGTIVTGASLLETYDRLEVLESTAEAIVHARTIGEVTAMPEAIIDDLKSHYGL